MRRFSLTQYSTVPPFHYSNWGEAPKFSGDSVRLPTDKAIAKISNYAFFEMQESLIRFDVKRGYTEMSMS